MAQLVAERDSPRVTTATASDRFGSRLIASARPYALLIGIVVVGFALRLFWVLLVDSPSPAGQITLGDQYSYYYYGREMAEGRGYVSYTTGQPTAYYPVGYPAILAVLFWFVAHTPFPDDYLLAAQLLNVVVSTAVVVFGYLIARRLFGPLAGLVAAGVIAVFPNLVFQVGSLQLETMFMFSCMAALCVLVLHDWTSGAPSTRRLVLFGAVLGVSVLVRPFSLWFIAAVFVAALVARLGWRRALVTAAIPLGIVVAMSVPWTIRNAVQLGAFVPTSTNTGDTLCLDRSEDATGGFRWADHEGCADPSLGELQRNSESTRKAISFVIEHPGRELVQIWRRTQLIFASDHDGIEASNLIGQGQVVSGSTEQKLSDGADRYFYVVTALAAAGVVIAAVRAQPHRRPESVFVLVAFASLVTVPMLLWGSPRFHLPFSPLLAVFAAGAVGGGVDWFGRRRRERHLAT
ncbi:MAG: ArnT family glycosyltransferase [Ilumatobacteraceae bacterium]